MRGNILDVGLAAVALLSLAAGPAAAVEVELLGPGKARNTVRVAILGAEGFDPRDMPRRGLVLGWSRQGRDGGYVPAIRLSRALRDVNGDGYRDRIAVFRLSDPDFHALQGGAVVQIELRGIHHDGVFGRAFVAQAPVVADSDPISACTAVTNQQGVLVGERCIWTTADGSGLKPIQVEPLVDGLNQALVTASFEIVPSSAVVIEAFGGAGMGGGRQVSGSCTAYGGSAGAAGYARTTLSAGALPPDLCIYPGGSAVNGGEGGAGSVVASADLNTVSVDALQATTADALADAGIIIALGGGGGGGGKGGLSDQNTECHHGGDGGAGGTAIASVAGAVAGGGVDGTRGDYGSGGNGAGGGGHPAGSDGTGGPGGIGYAKANGKGTGGGPLWAGWTTADNADYASTAWTYGAGGFDNTNAGSGGGGFGGGGSGDGSGDAHKGGGGGGSFATRATLDSSTIDADLIYGKAAGSSQIVVTFQLFPSAQ